MEKHMPPRDLREYPSLRSPLLGTSSNNTIWKAPKERACSPKPGAIYFAQESMEDQGQILLLNLLVPNPPR